MLKALLIKKDTIRLLRIPFSLFLAPVFLLSLSQAGFIDAYKSLWTFVIVHLLVYPSSNGYNSYIDRDEGSIGGLEKPPLPTRELFYTTLMLDICALVLALNMIGPQFAVCVAAYIAASRAYSSRRIRLKKRPYGGLLIVMFFQGAFTYFMCHTGISGSLPETDVPLLFIMAAASFHIGAAYPLTQVYQHMEDKASGDITISLILGKKGTFLFCAVMFMVASLFYGLYFHGQQRMDRFIIMQLFFLPTLIFFFSWYIKVRRDPSQASFRQAMRMNIISSVSASACYLYFFSERL